MSGHVVAAPVRPPPVIDRGAGAHGRYVPVTLAIVAIGPAVLLSSIDAPDMVTGSTHEHLAIAALGDWMWGGMATALLLLAAAFTARSAAMSGRPWLSWSPSSGSSSRSPASSRRRS